MASITEVYVSDKAGSATIEPPIDVDFALGGRHDIGDCVYAMELTEGRHDSDPFPSNTNNRRTLTQTARIDATNCNDSEDVSAEKARAVAEVAFMRYGRSLVWLP